MTLQTSSRIKFETTIKGKSGAGRRCLRRKLEVKDLVTLSLQGMDFYLSGFKTDCIYTGTESIIPTYPERRFASNVRTGAILQFFCFLVVKSAHNHYYFFILVINLHQRWLQAAGVQKQVLASQAEHWKIQRKFLLNNFRLHPVIMFSVSSFHCPCHR